MAANPEPRAASRESPPGGGATLDLLGGRDLLFAHGLTALSLGIGVSLLWAITDTTVSFWPRWVWFAVIVLWSLHAVSWLWAERARRQQGEEEAGSVEVGLEAAIALLAWSAAVIALIWFMTGIQSLWPRWPWFALLFTAGVLVALREALRRRRIAKRELALSARVGELTRTRRGALEVQAAELRRVERDLHDGAQSRLVALTMKLGRAEARLNEDPEAAALVREARDEAGAAITELRDLARGIAPPVLADRGLEAATRSLATRAGGPVQIEANLHTRPAPVLETAAYFVIAEAMTNAAKHAPGAAIRVQLDLNPERLLVRIEDDGPGGADPDGSGLIGLRHRVEAVDGSFAVTSARDQGTQVQANFPTPG